MDKKIIEVIKKIGNTPDRLIEVLLAVQKLSKENYITEEQLEVISKELNLSLSRVYGVATFYSMLSIKKRGKYVIQICNSGPCYVQGSKKIAKAFEDALGIKMGEVTEDGLFSLEFTSCFGACDKAPAIKINEKIYGNFDEEKVYRLVESLRKEEI